MRQIENQEKSGDGLFSSPLAVAGLLVAIVLVAFWWLWHSETAETAREAETATDLQRMRLDMDVLGAVEALRQIDFLTANGLSSAEFRQSLRAAVAADPRMRSLRLLDREGRQLLVSEETEAGDDARVEDAPALDPGIPPDFLADLRALPESEILVSEFALAGEENRERPALMVGSGLFFASGARAGFLVAEVEADDLISRMRGSGMPEGDDLYLVSADGRWIYDPRAVNPWQGVDEDGPKRWIVDDFPEVWRSMISKGDGSYVGDDIWVYRDHVHLETISGDERRVLAPGDEPVAGVNAKPFFVVRRVDDSATWNEIWAAVIPILLLFLLALAILIPALLRKREALARSEQSARELEEATLRTRMAMEAARISEWRIDLRSGKVSTDKRMAGMMLLGSEARIRTVEQWEERIHPNDRRKVHDTLEPLWEDGKGTFSIRHRMRRGDDSWGWYRFRGAVRRDDPDGEKYILGAYIDLTDVVMREVELNRLEMATRQSLSGIAILDKEGVVEWANPAFRGRSERKQTSLVSRPIWELLPFPEAEAASEKENIRGAIYRGDEFSLTVAHHPAGEESSWRRVTGNPVLDEGGIPANYVVIETDISREKRTEADLRKSESLLGESQRLAGIGSWEIDCEEDTLYWSDEIYRIFGVGKDFVPDVEASLRFFVESDHEAIRSHLDEAVRSGRQFEGEYNAVAADGEKKWVFVKGMALRESGVTSKVFGVIQDISSRKDYEEALIRSKEEAETLNERLAEALDKAHASERKAQEASEAKSAFLSMISHEIRNPLNGVIGMTSLLRETELDPVQDDYVETIHNSGSSLLMLLDDILDFSKIEHGKIEFEQKKFSIAATVEESVALFTARLDQKGIDHAFWIDPAVPETVVGDVTRVKQILFNLIGNAVKFTQEGSVTVEAELRERLPNDRCLLAFRVSDTGIGIPRERHDRIFQSFSQVDPSITRKFGGSGLGLAISKELSQRMGGDITFESAAGEGASFEVLLPFPAIFDKGRKPKRRAEGAKAFCLFGLETRARHFHDCLQAEGMEVALFEEARTWLEAARSAPPQSWIFGDAEAFSAQGAAEVFRRRPEAEGFRPPVIVTRNGLKTDFGFKAEVLQRPVSRKRIAALLEGSSGRKAGPPGTPKPEPLPGANGTMKILVAEDNAVNQKVIRLLLKRMGYGCELVENGRLALERAKAEDFDVILMDIQMPEMDGIEAAGRIVAEVPAARRPWIVALTAGATRDNREEALGAGMNGYLTKPVQPADLEGELERAANHLRERV